MSEVSPEDPPVLKVSRYFLVSSFQISWSIPPHGSTLMGTMVVVLPSLCKPHPSRGVGVVAELPSSTELATVHANR